MGVMVFGLPTGLDKLSYPGRPNEMNNLSRELVQSSMREALRTIRTFEQASREHGMILEVVSNFDLLTKTINTNRLQQYIMGTSILLLNPPKDGEPLLTIVEGEDSQLPLIRMEIN